MDMDNSQQKKVVLEMTSQFFPNFQYPKYEAAIDSCSPGR